MPERPNNISLVNPNLPVCSAAASDGVYDPVRANAHRIQRKYELLVIRHGALEIKLDSLRIRVPENYGVLLYPNESIVLSFSINSEGDFCSCAIDPCLIPEWIREGLNESRGPVPFIDEMNSFLNHCSATSVNGIEREALRDGFLLGNGLALLCEFAAAAKSCTARKTSSDVTLSRMDAFIGREFARDLSLSMIAKAAGASRQHLLKLCRLSKRPSPMEELYLRRVRAGSELLLNTDLSVMEIAESCGFVSPFHFSRRFKAAYGKSPLQWRQQAAMTCGRNQDSVISNSEVA